MSSRFLLLVVRALTSPPSPQKCSFSMGLRPPRAMPVDNLCPNLRACCSLWVSQLGVHCITTTMSGWVAELLVWLHVLAARLHW